MAGDHGRVVPGHLSVGAAVPAPVNFTEFVPLVSIVGMLFVFFGLVRARLAWVSERRSLGRLGGLIWLDYGPNRALAVVAFLGTCSAAGYYAARVLPWVRDVPVLGPVLVWNVAHWLLLFFVWLLAAVLAQTNVVPRLLLWGGGRISFVSGRLGYANASWHLQYDERARAAGLTRNGSVLAQAVMDRLVDEPQSGNLNRPIRPEGLQDDEAANILYFGHVIETVHRAGGLGPYSPMWRDLYAALGRVAVAEARPFITQAVMKAKPERFFIDVIRLLNDEAVKGGTSIPACYTLERAVTAACILLQDRFASDARGLGARWWRRGYSYGAAVGRSRAILDEPGLRVQFATLGLLWRIWGTDVAGPGRYIPPFSRGVLGLLLDESLILTDADSFDTEDPRVRTVARRGVEMVLDLAAEIAGGSRETALVLEIEKGESGGEEAWCAVGLVSPSTTQPDAL